MPFEGPQRYWRETQEFEECRAAIQSDTQRFDEFFRGIEFALLTDAEAVSWEVSNTNLRVMRTEADWGFPGVPDLWIYFRIVDDGKCCELVWMQEAEEFVVAPGEEDEV